MSKPYCDYEIASCENINYKSDKNDLIKLIKYLCNLIIKNNIVEAKNIFHDIEDDQDKLNQLKNNKELCKKLISAAIINKDPIYLNLISLVVNLSEFPIFV